MSAAVLSMTMELWGLALLLGGIGLFVAGLTIWGKGTARAAMAAEVAG
jgi:hypothetical protein